MQNFLSCYGIATIVISLIDLSVTKLVEILSKKKSKALSVYLPFLLGILLNFIYDSLFVYKSLCFSESGIYNGILCGSFSTVIENFLLGLKKGSIKTDCVLLLIEGLIKDYVDSSLLEVTAKEIKTVIETNSEEKEQISKIEKLLTENVEEKDGIKNLSVLILKSVKEITRKKEK